MFLEDKYAPSAIFLEYIPGIQMIFPHHYTKERPENFINGIQEIHKAMVLHLDARPRNMMIIEDDPERAIWLGFDRAQTYCAPQLGEWTRSGLKNEEQVVRKIGELLVSDCCGTRDCNWMLFEANSIISWQEADCTTGEIDKEYLLYCS